MSYTLKQKHWISQEDKDNIFASLIDVNGVVDRVSGLPDSNVNSNGGINYFDTCLKGVNLKDKTSYYFHGLVKRLNVDQVIYIKLYNGDYLEGDAQILKRLTIAKSEEEDWVDIELIFTPFFNYNNIVFQLERNADVGDREAIVVFEELSEIKNCISTYLETKAALSHIGVQSHPGFLMCINNSEIRVGRTGIYEIKEGVMDVEYFSVIAAAKEEDVNILDQAKKAAPACIFDSKKRRIIDTFTIDYVYEEA